MSAGLEWLDVTQAERKAIHLQFDLDEQVVSMTQAELDIISAEAAKFYASKVRETKQRHVPYSNSAMKRIISLPLTVNGRDVVEHLYPLQDRIMAQHWDMEEWAAKIQKMDEKCERRLNGRKTK